MNKKDIMSMCNISLTVKMSEESKKKIMNLADEMAAAATERNAHSYENLIRARHALEIELENSLAKTYNV